MRVERCVSNRIFIVYFIVWLKQKIVHFDGGVIIHAETEFTLCPSMEHVYFTSGGFLTHTWPDYTHSETACTLIKLGCALVEQR